MKKTHKKRDNDIRKVLNQVCEDCLKEIDGFVWLTHMADFDQLARTLRVICVFATQNDLTEYARSLQSDVMQTRIIQSLQHINIVMAAPHTQIIMDSEEACSAQHNGNWAKRLASMS